MMQTKTKIALVLLALTVTLGVSGKVIADNVSVTQGAGTSVAADDISAVLHQLVKVEFGADGAATMVSASNPMPVTVTNGEKAEDAAHTSGDKGLMGLFVRTDTMASLAGTTGDYAPGQLDSSGRLRVTNTVAAGDGDTIGSSLGATNTGTATLAAPLVLTSVQFCNGDSATATGKVYNKASAATSGDTPILRIRALAGTCQTVMIPERGAALSAGLSFRAVTENTDAGTTGVGANTAMFNYTYK